MESIEKLIENIHDSLNKLENLIQEQYAERVDDPGLVFQMQTLRIMRTNCYEAFPLVAKAKVVETENEPEKEVTKKTK